MSLDHPNIIKVFGMYEDDASVFIVTELLRGGELFDRIVQHEYYSEGMAARVPGRLPHPVSRESR